jgi:hypothetical protein
MDSVNYFQVILNLKTAVNIQDIVPGFSYYFQVEIVLKIVLEICHYTE